MKSEKGAIEIVLGIIMGVIVLAMIGSFIYLATIEYQNEEIIEIVVKDKYIKRDGERDIYLVASEAGDTYKIWIGYNKLDKKDKDMLK